VLVTQDLRRVDAREAAERFGVPPAQARFGVLVEVGAVASFELALSGPFFAGLSVEGLARVSKQDERAVTSLSGRVAVLTGLRF